MTITKKTVADKIAAYLHHEITLAQLVDWSENVLIEGELADHDAGTLSSVRRTPPPARFFSARRSGRGVSSNPSSATVVRCACLSPFPVFRSPCV